MSWYRSFQIPGAVQLGSGVMTQSDTTKAISCILNQWQALVYCCGDGMAEIDNNIAEDALRLADRQRQAQRYRSAGLFVPCTGQHRRLSD